MKSKPFLVVGLLLLSSIAIVSVGEEAGTYQQTLSKSFLDLNIIEEDQYIKLEMEGANSAIFSDRKPVLPMYTETLTLPFGITVNDVQCQVKDIETMVLSKDIIPCPEAIPASMKVEFATTVKEDITIYNSEDLFPDDWFSYNIGVGLDENMEHKTFLTINTYPIRYRGASDTINYAKSIEVTVDYNVPKSNPFPTKATYDLVIIAPSWFEKTLQGLVNHKNSIGVSTKLVTTTEIYKNHPGNDKPEQIKRFIKSEAIETWNAKYVLLVGGLKNYWLAEGRDNLNEGTKDWWLPVRYSNIEVRRPIEDDPVNYTIDEPGLVSDLYYADIYKAGGAFETWDPNLNGIYGEWEEIDIDYYPDIAVGRLPCRNRREVKNAVQKIKKYEDGPCDSSWFNNYLVISGDGFLDQDQLNFAWDTNAVPNGEYTIHAQSRGVDDVLSVVQEIDIKVDKTAETKLTWHHDDNLITNLKYPYLKPVVLIPVCSDGDVLGKDPFNWRPPDREAYCNDFSKWANINYSENNDGIFYIRAKSYDPRPYGVETDVHVWITNSGGSTVYNKWIYDTEMYFEGEWVTGEKVLYWRAGAAYYMPPIFNTEFLWTSNGKFAGMSDVIKEMSKGQGFVFFSGHGSPAVWADHYPGIPGNRQNGSVYGLKIFELYDAPPFFPMNKIKNTYENPILVVGGCHNSMINVTAIPTFQDKHNEKMTHSYGNPTPKCWGWWIASMPKTGAIASMGNTGYGYGYLGWACTIGGADSWMCTEFFRQYALGQDILGGTHSSAITSYIQNFGKYDDGDRKEISQFILLGDPSLQIGGT